jgi:hypothetical protein
MFRFDREGTYLDFNGTRRTSSPLRSSCSEAVRTTSSPPTWPDKIVDGVREAIDTGAS